MAGHNQTDKPRSAAFVSYFETLLPQFHFVCVFLYVCLFQGVFVYVSVGLCLCTHSMSQLASGSRGVGGVKFSD